MKYSISQLECSIILFVHVYTLKYGYTTSHTHRLRSFFSVPLVLIVRVSISFVSVVSGLVSVFRETAPTLSQRLLCAVLDKCYPDHLISHGGQSSLLISPTRTIVQLQGTRLKDDTDAFKYVLVLFPEIPCVAGHPKK